MLHSMLKHYEILSQEDKFGNHVPATKKKKKVKVDKFLFKIGLEETLLTQFIKLTFVLKIYNSYVHF
jgi:hypothetical protein